MARVMEELRAALRSVEGLDSDTVLHARLISVGNAVTEHMRVSSTSVVQCTDAVVAQVVWGRRGIGAGSRQAVGVASGVLAVVSPVWLTTRRAVGWVG